MPPHNIGQGPNQEGLFELPSAEEFDTSKNRPIVRQRQEPDGRSRPRIEESSGVPVDDVDVVLTGEAVGEDADEKSLPPELAGMQSGINLATFRNGRLFTIWQDAPNETRDEKVAKAVRWAAYEKSQLDLDKLWRRYKSALAQHEARQREAS